MAVNNIQPVDQGAFLLDNMFSQYRSKTRFPELIQGLAETILQDIQQQAFNLYWATHLIPNDDEIPAPTGNQLDLAGKLIGLPRMAVRNPSDVWELDVTPFTEHKFGDIDYLIYQLAPDDIYRDAILAYAYTQNTCGDLKSLEYCLLKILNPLAVTIVIEQTATLAVDITVSKIPGGATFDVGRKYLVDTYLTPNGGNLWPKVAGVIYTFTWPT